MYNHGTGRGHRALFVLRQTLGPLHAGITAALAHLSTCGVLTLLSWTAEMTGKNLVGLLGQDHTLLNLRALLQKMSLNGEQWVKKRHGVKNTHFVPSTAINCDCVWRAGCSAALLRSCVWLFSFLLAGREAPGCLHRHWDSCFTQDCSMFSCFLSGDDLG